MQIILDVLLVLAFAAVVFKYWKTGFFKSVLSAGRLILTVVLTIVLGPAVSAWLDEKFINPPVFEKVHEKLAEIGAQAASSSEQFFADMSDKFGTFLGEDTFNEGAASAQSSVSEMVEQYSVSIAGKISIVIATVIGYVLLFLICFLILTLVIFIIGKVVKLPLLKTCDKLLGLVLGIIIAFFAAALIATLVYGILYLTGDLKAYESSYVLKFFYDLHIFRFILDKVF